MSIGGALKVGYVGQWIGEYCIRGTVSRLGVPGPYRVSLFARREQIPLRTQIAKENGDHAFDYIPLIEGGYFLIGFDHTADDLRNAAIADRITPKAMLSELSGDGPALDIGGDSGGTTKTIGHPF